MTGQRFERLIDAPRWFGEHTPDAPAAWFDGESTTYAQLDAEVDRLARALVTNGVRKGDRVAVLSPPSTDFLVALLGVQRAGGVYVGVNPGYTRREQLHVLTDSAPVMLLSIADSGGRDYANEISELLPDTPSVATCFRLGDGPTVGPLRSSEDLHRGIAATVPLPRINPLDPAAIVYTSGSTGTPKGALLPHAGLAYGAHTDADAMGVEGPRVACNLPINHVGCIVDVVGCALVSGGMVAFLERFDPGEMLHLIEELRLTNLQHVPTVLQILTQVPEFTTCDLSSLRVVAWGGAALPIDVVRSYRALGVHLQTVYGQTEIISNATWSRPGDSDEALAATVGQVNPDADVRIVDEDGRDVVDGEEGEVLYRHPSQFLGYFNNPEATAATITDDGFVRTGDVAIRRPDGNLVLVGRRSDMYKSGGLNVYPREVELELESHPAVALAAIVSVPDEKYGEVGVAYVMREPGADVDAVQLHDWCRSRVAGYKVPKRFEVREALPLLPIGKVDKQTLKKEALA